MFERVFDFFNHIQAPIWLFIILLYNYKKSTEKSNDENKNIQDEKKNVNIIKNFYPVEYKEIEEIAKAILDGYTVEVDLSSMANENIVRTLDFLSGLTYGRGKVNRRSKYEFTFVINE